MGMPTISVENLSKCYRIGARTMDRTLGEGLRDAVLAPWRRLRRFGQASHRAEDAIWALNGISFEVQAGEVLGVIGRNGSGKSTLLKILSRITAPTGGRAVLNGRVGSLLEVGTGFHAELTGRENVFLSGAILGMTKREIASKFDAIVEFSGVGKFLDTPVKRFSSGMGVRLGFAVAAHLEPEVLLVDEVLAVGDAAFQRKCVGKMSEVAREGRTVLFVSHNLAAVQSLCTRAIVLQQGRMHYDGGVMEGIAAYLAALESNAELDLSRRARPALDGPAFFTGVRFSAPSGEPVAAAIAGQPLDIVLAYRTREPRLVLDCVIGVYNSLGEKVLHLGTEYAGHGLASPADAAEVVCRIPKLPLPEGRYRLNLELGGRRRRLDQIEGAAFLDVAAGDFYGTGRIPPPAYQKVFVDHTWAIRPAGAGG